MFRQITLAACGLSAVLATVARAEGEPGVVVELYTSQGCSSCPPADALMGELAGMPGVIGLALHVDYWDYIGWTDTFADARFTDRQKAYAHAAGERMIYTPQMIVAGAARVEGNQPGLVAAAIAESAATPDALALDLQRDGDRLLVTAQGSAALPQGSTVQLVRYRDAASVQIDRGENAGLDVQYRNIVTSWQKIGEWSGAGPFTLETAVTGPEPLVVIVQEPGPARILAAARLK